MTSGSQHFRVDTNVYTAGLAVKLRIQLEGIPTRLAEVRTETGLGSREFAEELTKRTGYYVTHSSVLAYEKPEGDEKHSDAPAKYLAAVAKGFGFSESWLLFEEGQPREVEHDQATLALKMIQDVLDAAKEGQLKPMPKATFRLLPEPPTKKP